VAVRWYLRYGLSYRDVEELLAERGVTVDHVTVYRWVQRFTPEFIEAARRDLPAARRFFTRGAASRYRSGRGHHRPRARLPASTGRAGSLGPAYH
jgi:hypothetical protein